METTALMQCLKGFCDNSCWKFAVFWKVRLGSPMILTWEDGYVHHLRPIKSMEIIAEDIFGNWMDDMFLPECEASMYDDRSGEHPIDLVVADMSCLQYAWGEGVVGEVACTGNHCWVTFEDVLTCVAMGYKCPEEWLLQFAAGIKTILLVPLLPHGVLQLGSLEEVTEDLEVINYLKSRFSILKSDHEDILPFTLKREAELWSSSPSTSISMENSNIASTMPISLSKSGDFGTNGSKLSTLYEVEPLLSTEDTSQPLGRDHPEIVKHACKSEINVELVRFSERPTSPSRSKNLSQLGISQAELLGFSCMGEELKAHSDFSDFGNKVIEGSFSSTQIMNAYPEDSASEARDANISDDEIMNNFFSFPGHGELHKALGPLVERQNGTKLFDASFSCENTGSNPSIFSDVIEPSWFLSEDDTERLLEGVVADLFGILDDTSAGSDSFKSKVISKQFAAPPQLERNLEAGGLMSNDIEPRNLSSPATGGNAASSSSSASMKSMLTTLIEEKSNKVYGMHSRKGQKTSNLNKRHGRVGDNHKPRPRDRQMTQDRVKELRGLVPSGAKCSIDGLFDRTIKHMLFLRRMTEQAEKLKQWRHQEEAARKKLRSQDAANTAGNGRSWAVELGSEVQRNPIVIEDLPYPGHMLIEMLCDDHSFFLKISQVICDLKLKILKGVMECHSRNTWALFIVEASKGFHRMDIFWPLMHLLHHKRTLSSWM